MFKKIALGLIISCSFQNVSAIVDPSITGPVIWFLGSTAKIVYYAVKASTGI